MSNSENFESMAISFDPVIHRTSVPYSVNTQVIDEDGDIYLSILVVPAGIALDNTTYWLEVAKTPEAGGGGVVDNTLTADGQILIVNGGVIEAFSLTDGESYGIDAAGAPGTFSDLAVPGNSFGFDSFGITSHLTKLAHTVPDGSDISAMDFALDKGNCLITAMGTPSLNGRIEDDADRYTEIQNSFYARCLFGATFEDIIKNRNKAITQFTSTFGRYVFIIDGVLYVRNHNQTRRHRVYDMAWLGATSISFDNAVHTALNFELSSDLLAVQTRRSFSDGDGNPATDHRLLIYRFETTGSVGLISDSNGIAMGTDVVATGRYGFTSYGEAPGEASEAHVFFLSSTGTIMLNQITTADAINSVASPPGNYTTLYPYRNANYFARATDGRVTRIISHNQAVPISDTLNVPLMNPNAFSGYANDNGDGVIFVFDNTVAVFGENNFGELGQDDLLSLATAPVNTELFPFDGVSEYELKDAMFFTVGDASSNQNQAACFVWSDRELWYSGFAGATFAQLGRVINNANDKETLVGVDTSSLFKKVFVTGNTIKDIYILNHSQGSLNLPTINILLSNGLCYSKSPYAPDGDLTTGVYELDPVIIPSSLPGITGDRFNVKWRRLSI